MPRSRLRSRRLLAAAASGGARSRRATWRRRAAAALKALGRDASIKLRVDARRRHQRRPLPAVSRRIACGGARCTTATSSRGIRCIVSQSIIKGSPFEMMIKDGIDPTMVEGATRPAVRHSRTCACQRAHDGGRRADAVVALGRAHAYRATATETLHRRAAGGSRQGSGARPACAAEGCTSAMRACCSAVAKLAQWNGAKASRTRARGVAVHKSFDTYVAQIAEVSRGEGRSAEGRARVVRGRLRRRGESGSDQGADGRRHRLSAWARSCTTRSRSTRAAWCRRTSTTIACCASTRCQASTWSIVPSAEKPTGVANQACRRSDPRSRTRGAR